MAVACLVAAAGCLSKPDRPDGPGFDGDGDGGTDGGYLPDSGFQLRRQVAIGDLDGDGIDDLVLWGNAGETVEQRGQLPVIRVYFGSSSGLTPAPDTDMRHDLSRPWYEVLDVAIEPDGSLAFLTAEDLEQRSGTPVNRRIRAGVIPVDGNQIDPPVFRSQDDLVVSGYADDPAPAFVLARDNAVADSTRLVFGFQDSEQMWLPTIGTSEQLTAADSTVLFWDEESPVLQEAFSNDNDSGGEDLIIVTREMVGRTVGDAGAGQDILQRAIGGDCARIARGHSEYGYFFGVVSCAGEPDVTVIESLEPMVTPSVFPYQLPGTTSATDFDVIDVGGDPLLPDLVMIQEGVLVVYGDLSIGPPPMSEWEASMPIEGYDLIAAGHFFAPAEHQIYLFSTTDGSRLPLCLEIDELFRLVPCADM